MNIVAGLAGSPAVLPGGNGSAGLRVSEPAKDSVTSRSVKRPPPPFRRSARCSGCRRSDHLLGMAATPPFGSRTGLWCRVPNPSSCLAWFSACLLIVLEWTVLKRKLPRLVTVKADEKSLRAGLCPEALTVNHVETRDLEIGPRHQTRNVLRASVEDIDQHRTIF